MPHDNDSRLDDSLADATDAGNVPFTPRRPSLEDQTSAPRSARRDDHGGDLVAHPETRLDFSVNVNPLGTPARVRQAIIDGLATIGRYPDPHCRALRRALANHHGIDPASIVCGNGASDIIWRVVAARQPRRVLTVAPTFTEYARSALAIGAEVVHHRLHPPLFDVDGTFLEALTGDIDMVFLCQPNNPTGRLIPTDLLTPIIEKTARIGATLVIDECFLPFTDAESLIAADSPADATPTGLPPHVIVIRAFTKTHGLAGVRLGYAVSNDCYLITAMADQPPHWNVSSLAQVAGCAAAGLTGWDERTRALVRAERAYLTAELTRLGLEVVDSDANFLLFRCDPLMLHPEAVRAWNEDQPAPAGDEGRLRHRHDLQSLLLDQGILIRACASFIGLDETYFRVGLHSRNDNIALVEAITHALSGRPQPPQSSQLLRPPASPHPNQHPRGGTP